jgi:phospho-N-acetylmuramoyl-pentapeptide-transferase
MIYLLTRPFADVSLVANLLRYLTFRSGAACLTALLLSLTFGPSFIRLLKSVQLNGQPIRPDGPERHLLEKKGTPTMGGVLILAALTISTLLWADLRNGYVWAVLLLTLGYAALGFVDDYIKLAKSSHKGVSARGKLIIQLVLGLLASYWISSLTQGPLGTGVTIPVFKDVLIPLGALFPLFGMAVMLGFSNAVNLTDGLDGLAAGVSTMVLGAYVLIGIWTSNQNCQTNPGIKCYEVRDSLDLAVVAAAGMGACFGFLWWNASPAKIFMGDTGSLGLGGLIAGLAICTRTELLVVILAGLFVLEVVSVMAQVASFKLTGKRVLRMAPLHHHFELIGWDEITITIRFWLIAGICVAAGLGVFYAEWVVGS